MRREESDVRLSLAEGRAPTVVVKGEIDWATAPRLRSCLEEAGALAPAEVVLDMTELTFIDSANLGVLAVAHKALAAQGSRLVVTNAPPAAIMVFRLSGLEQMLTVRAGPEDSTR